MQSPVAATKFHCRKSVLDSTADCNQRPTFFRSRQHFKFNRPSSVSQKHEYQFASHNRIPDNNLASPRTPTIYTRDIWVCTRCINISWRWVSQIISFYLFCLNLVANAEAYDYPSTTFTYACEDVNNYYANVEHLEGKALKKKLNSIISRHQSLSYREVWNALKILDASNVDSPEASSGIVEVYSLRVVPKSSAGKPEGWNSESIMNKIFCSLCDFDEYTLKPKISVVFEMSKLEVKNIGADGEHLWPRSYGLKHGPSLTDIHNIRPADVNVNSSRGNKYYGECNVNSAKCLKPANKEAALDTETDKDKWAPPKQHRGDIARALMYMAVCYGFRQPDGGPVLHLSDSPKLSNSEMGLLSTLLKWNEIDPPSREEKLRNERICKFYQHNRNPFVDHPEYANLIWQEHILSSHSFYHLPRSHEIHNNKRQS